MLAASAHALCTSVSHAVMHLLLPLVAHTHCSITTGAGTLMEADIAVFLQRWGAVVLAATTTATAAAATTDSNSSSSSSAATKAAAAGSTQT
jgi:hypothetical protein